MSKPKDKLKKALRDKVEVKNLRATAKELETPPCVDTLGASFMRLDADELEEQAQKALKIPENELPAVGCGGELSLSKERAEDLPALINTLEKPDNVTAEASQERLQLIFDSDCTGLALDAAETIQAKNSLEKMLAHQLGAAHKLAMTFASRSLSNLSESDKAITFQCKEYYSLESIRASNASARMMESFQKGILALNKLRNGGSQTITVQHINVKNGGQAVVAGAFDTRGDHEKRQ